MKGQSSVKSKGFNKHYCIPCKLSRKKCSKQLPVCDQCKSISFCCQYLEEETHLKIRFYKSKAQNLERKKRANSKPDNHTPIKVIKKKDIERSNESIITNSTDSSVANNISIQSTKEPIYSPNLTNIPYSFIQSPQLLHSVDSFNLIQTLFNTPPNSELDSKSDCSTSTSTYDCFNKKEFWDELVQLFIAQFHPLQPIFDLRHFDVFALSPACQAIIHSIGYHLKKEKCQNIAQYLVRRVEVLSKPMIFKPTLLNTQAYTLMSTYSYLVGDYKKSQFYLQQAIRFSLLLGLHQIPEWVILEGKLFEYALTWKSIQALSCRSSTISLTLDNIALSDEQNFQNPIMDEYNNY